MAASFAHGREVEICRGCNRESFVGLLDGLCYHCGRTRCHQCLKVMDQSLQCVDCNSPGRKRKRSDEEIADIKMKRIKEAVGLLFSMTHYPHRFY